MIKTNKVDIYIHVYDIYIYIFIYIIYIYIYMYDVTLSTKVICHHRTCQKYQIHFCFRHHRH